MIPAYEMVNILENGHLVEARKFNSVDIPSSSEEDVKHFFDAQMSEGWHFLKAFKEDDKKYSLFIPKEKLNMLFGLPSS